MSKFGTFEFSEDDFGDDVGGSPSNPYPDIIDERIAWKFFDGVNVYNLQINPNSASMPVKKRRISHQPTCAGRIVTYEGRPETQSFNFSGVILSEEQFRLLSSWVRKSKQVQITDDLGKTYWVYFKTFEPKRKRNNSYDWYMDYAISGVVLDRG